MRTNRIGSLVLLHIALLIYAFCAVLMKIAASHDAFSFDFILFYILAVGVMGIYAILWQQVLKRVSLTVAFSNKAVTVLWGMILGYVIFHEAITWKMIIGALIIIVGIIVMVNGEKSG
ncbi:MAG: EamA family transporter [Bacillota bacterium]